MLTIGSKGQEVVVVKQLLAKQGFWSDAQQGLEYTLKLAEAVTYFQQTHLNEQGNPCIVDGNVGPETLWALKHSTGKAQKSSLAPNQIPSGIGNMRTKILEIALAQYGIKEVPNGSNRGTTPNGGVDKFLPDWMTKTNKKGPAWCFTGDVELLTENGWVPFNKLSNDIRVAQVIHDKGNHFIDLINPVAFIEKEHQGLLVEINRRGMKGIVCDSDHRFYGKWMLNERKALKKTWNDYELYPIKKMIEGNSALLCIPSVTGVSTLDNSNITDKELIFIGAFMADGFIHKKKEGQGKDNIEFQVSREDKIKWLTDLQPRSVYQAKTVYGPKSTKPLTTFRFNIENIPINVFGVEKSLKSEFIWSLSSRQCRLILDTMFKFDGSITGQYTKTIAQSSKLRIDSLQLLAVLGGYHSSVRDAGVFGEFGSHMYILTFHSAHNICIKRNQIITHEDNTKLYCVQVPSGLIVVRSPGGGIPFVVGNCCFFVSWVTKEAFGRYPLGKRYGSCAQAMTAAESLNMDRSSLNSAAPGDAFVMLHDNGTGHIGFVYNISPDFQYFNTVEGNCGNRVKIGKRAACDIKGYINFYGDNICDFNYKLLEVEDVGSAETR